MSSKLLRSPSRVVYHRQVSSDAEEAEEAEEAGPVRRSAVVERQTSASNSLAEGMPAGCWADSGQQRVWE
jgi:hypothetical protein